MRKFPEACRAGAVTLGRGGCSRRAHHPTERLREDLPGQRAGNHHMSQMGWMRRVSLPHLIWGHRAKIHLSLPALPNSNPHSPPRELGAQVFLNSPSVKTAPPAHRAPEKPVGPPVASLQATTQPQTGREPGALRPVLGTEHRSPCTGRAVGRPASSC